MEKVNRKAIGVVDVDLARKTEFGRLVQRQWVEISAREDKVPNDPVVS